METSTAESIRFSAPHDKGIMIRAGKIRWKLQSKSSLRSVYLLLISFIGFVCICLFSYKNGSKDFIEETYITVAVAVAFLYESSNYRKRKKYYQNLIFQMADRLDEFLDPVTYEFSEEKVCYRDAEKYLELKWNTLKAYSFYGEYLIIWLGKTSFDALVFKENEEGLDAEKYIKLMELIKIKLPLK